MEGGKEAKRAEIESAMDAIIASSFLPSFPAPGVFSGIHDASDRGRPRRRRRPHSSRRIGGGSPSIALFSYANSSFSFLRSHGECAGSGEQLRSSRSDDGVVIMRAARPLVGIGMSSKQLAPLSLQQALVTRRRLIQHRRFWPATLHFLVLAAVALSLLMLTSAELYLPTQKQI